MDENFEWTIFRQVVGPAGVITWEMPADGTGTGFTSLKEIPFVPVYGRRLGFMVAKPPMLELAYLNVKHWQSQSDQDTLLHVARVPILVMSGVEDEKFDLVIGSGKAVKLPGIGSTLGFVEHTGQAIGAGQTSLDKLVDEMRQAGAEMLVMSQGGPVTATEIASDSAIGMCHLQKVALGVESSMNQAIDLMGDFVNLEETGTVKLFSDFGAATLAEASAQLLVMMATASKLSNETLFSEFQRRGLIAADKTWEDEHAKIEAQGPALGAIPPINPNPNQPPPNRPLIPSTGKGALQ